MLPPSIPPGGSSSRHYRVCPSVRWKLMVGHNILYVRDRHADHCLFCLYTGEGARHAGDPNYYRLILLHALFGAFAFLVFTPAAIICARFLIHGPRPRLAMFGHIGFQIASVICLTITFITGYFAVDRGSWGKNPHHVRLSQDAPSLGAGLTFRAADHWCDTVRRDAFPGIFWHIRSMEGSSKDQDCTPII